MHSEIEKNLRAAVAELGFQRIKNFFMHFELEHNLRTAVADLDALNHPANETAYFDIEMEDAFNRFAHVRDEIVGLPNSPQSIRLRALALVADAHVSLECDPEAAAQEDLVELARTYWPERIDLIEAVGRC